MIDRIDLSRALSDRDHDTFKMIDALACSQPLPRALGLLYEQSGPGARRSACASEAGARGDLCVSQAAFWR
jgi:hypothetical protein